MPFPEKSLIHHHTERRMNKLRLSKYPQVGSETAENIETYIEKLQE
jgi:hypothetical protein